MEINNSEPQTPGGRELLNPELLIWLNYVIKRILINNVKSNLCEEFKKW